MSCVAEDNLEEQILEFNPPYPVFRVALDGLTGTELVVQEPLGYRDLRSKMRVAMPHPWKPGEDRFLPGEVHGDDGIFFLELGESFGVLEHHPELGWLCRAMVRKDSEAALEALEAKKLKNFTDRLLRRSSKKKKNS